MMIINKEWRILTVGDGDLSFSYSLHKHHQVKNLTASIFDSHKTMTEKYNENAFLPLHNDKVPLLFSFDITNPKSWSTLKKNSFDVVIFQFPLLPAFRSFDEYKQHGEQFSINTLNRTLLRTFLKNAFNDFLDPTGEQLCFITSKDVKPYKEWNIENSLHQQTNFQYLGSSLFNIDRFPDYKVRNVDRDKHVRDTQGRTYVWGLREDHQIKGKLEEAVYQDKNCCTICRAGPFVTESDKQQHNVSKKHQQMLTFEAQWSTHLKKENNVN